MAGIGCEIQDQVFDEYLERKFGGRPFPYSGQWELTYRCNLKCVMCYTDCFNTPERIRQELRFSEIRRILDELQQAGCLYLCFTGGEPLAHPDFLEIYTDAKKKGFLLTIFTNGTLITPRIADHWALFRPYMIEISFHGLTRQSFDAITQKEGSYERCLRGIRLLLERRLPLTIKSAGMTLNQDEILQIKAMAESFGDEVQYKFGADIRENLDGTATPFRFQLPRERIIAIIENDPEMKEERVHKEALEKKDSGCGGGTYKFHIDAYGGLQLCSFNRRRTYDLRHGSFKEGFYHFLPSFPCPNRSVIPEEKLFQKEFVRASDRSLSRI